MVVVSASFLLVTDIVSLQDVEVPQLWSLLLLPSCTLVGCCPLRASRPRLPSSSPSLPFRSSLSLSFFGRARSVAFALLSVRRRCGLALTARDLIHCCGGDDDSGLSAPALRFQRRPTSCAEGTPATMTL